MKTIFEYLLSKSKPISNVERPTKDSSFEDIIDWIKSYEIPKYGPTAVEPGKVVYDKIQYKDTKISSKKHSFSFIKLISRLVNGKQQSVTLYPYNDDAHYTSIERKNYSISFEEAIDFMEQIMEDPTTILPTYK